MLSKETLGPMRRLWVCEHVCHGPSVLINYPCVSHSVQSFDTTDDSFTQNALFYGRSNHFVFQCSLYPCYTVEHSHLGGTGAEMGMTKPKPGWQVCATGPAKSEESMPKATK